MLKTTQPRDFHLSTCNRKNSGDRSTIIGSVIQGGSRRKGTAL